ncbi:MAG: Swt1 family HEPN domain-containing protein [Chloroflexales bacterium]|nr:Swt1 family HEPN domain-containing protein [Chloroflexales bacterium]
MTSDQVRRIQIDQLLAEFRQGYAPFVMAVLKSTHGTEWYSVLRNTPEVRLPADFQNTQLDATALVRVILAHWDTTFNRALTPAERNHLFELRTIRNRWAHQAPLTEDDVDRLADNIARLLTAIRANNVETVITLRDEMRSQRYQQKQLTASTLRRIIIAAVSLAVVVVAIGFYFWEHDSIKGEAIQPIGVPTVLSTQLDALNSLSATTTALPDVAQTALPGATLALNQTNMVTETAAITPTTVVIVKVVQVTAVITATPLPSFPCHDGQIKANAKTMIYHLPTGAFYATTRNSAVICFDTPADAEQAGYRVSKR